MQHRWRIPVCQGRPAEYVVGPLADIATLALIFDYDPGYFSIDATTESQYFIAVVAKRAVWATTPT